MSVARLGKPLQVTRRYGRQILAAQQGEAALDLFAEDGDDPAHAALTVRRQAMEQASAPSARALSTCAPRRTSEEFLKTRRGILQYVVGEGNGHAMNGLVCIDPETAGRPVGRGTYEWGGAFSTFFWIDPENDLVFVGMMNRQRGMTEVRPPEVVAQELVYRALKR